MRLKRVRVDLRGEQLRYIDDLVKVQAKYQDRMKGIVPDMELVVSPEQFDHYRDLFQQQIPYGLPVGKEIRWNGFRMFPQ